eukprot:SAG31_NODE_7207_length_1755_cov_1.482488_2_plen_73_part_00
MATTNVELGDGINLGWATAVPTEHVAPAADGQWAAGRQLAVGAFVVPPHLIEKIKSALVRHQSTADLANSGG